MKFDNPDDVVVTEKLLSASLNWKMLQSGLAYPLIYTSNPVPHRALLRSVAIEARAKASPRTVWARDSSGEFVLRDKASIEPPDGSLIMPKLFRRCVDYLKAVDAGTIHGNLTDWLHANDHTENDRVLFNGIEQPFSSLILQKNAKIALQGDFVDYVFVER
ncbi:MAG: nuclease-like protein [Candidatus Eremiobacteraeota bacterium]|nr:nuclease-like protein [Candidatus Eremiobacteraeota bacterium]